MSNTKRREDGVFLTKPLVWAISGVLSIVAMSAVGWGANMDRRMREQETTSAVIQEKVETNRNYLQRIESKIDALIGSKICE